MIDLRTLNKAVNMYRPIFLAPNSSYFRLSLCLKILFIYLFLDRGEGREKERERSVDVQTPPAGPCWPVPPLGIEPADPWFTGGCSVH